MIANPNITAQQQVKPSDGETLLWACDQRDCRTLGPGLLNDATNLRFNDGVPATRKGVVKPAWANYTSPASLRIGSLGTPYGAGVFRDPDGVEWQIVAAGGQVWRTRPGNANLAIPLPTGVMMVNACRFVQAFDRLFCFRGRFLAPLVLSDLGVGFTDLLPQFDPANAYNAPVVAISQAAQEMAYGPYQAVATLTWTGAVANLVTVAAHGYVNGADVTVLGAQNAPLNGRFGITVLDEFTFTYAIPSGQLSAPTGTDAGTITVSNNAYYWNALGSLVTVRSILRAGKTSLTLTSLTCAIPFTVGGVSAGPVTVTVTSLTHVTTTATATTATPHGLSSGQTVTIAGAQSHPTYNGQYTITVTGANTFTYTLATAPSGSSLDYGMTATAAYGEIATVSALKHGLSSGQTVTMAGATGTGSASFNGTFIVTVLNTNQFQYTMTSNPGIASAAGTITCAPANDLTATATAAGHGLTTGMQVIIAGAAQTAYNGTFYITVISSSQFQYTMAATPAATPATGTITAARYTGANALVSAPGHGLVSGDYVTIAGSTVAAFNGTFPITVVDANTFNYTMSVDPGADAAGAITCQAGRTLAGQTPDTNPGAWARSYNILPNADTALFIQNLLLVPTAYQPSSVNNYATITGGAYSTVDFIVATNYLDYIHFQFNNELRINQGTADQIVDLFAFGPGNVVILKTKSWAMLTGLNTGSVASVALQFMSKEYGAAGPRSWAVVGSNAYFLSPTYGVVVIRQTDLGVMLSVNVPLSAPIQRTIDQVDWTQGGACRMNQWDNKLYLALVLKSGQRVICVYDFKASVRMGNNVWESGVMTQGWTPMDTGSAMAVQEFFRLTLNGTERHFYLDTAGYVNLLEEHDGPDQIALTGTAQGLGWEEIETYALSRAYGTSLKGNPWPTEAALSLATFNPTYTIAVVFPGENNSVVVAQNVTRSNLKYDRPFTALPWDPTNSNDDWATPWRQDYSVALPPNVVPAGATYQARPLQYNLTVVQGVIYLFVPGPNDAVLNYTSGLTAMQTSGGTFVQSGPFGGNVQLLASANLSDVGPVTAFVGRGFNLGSGIVLDQYQEMLDTRRVGTRRGKDFQLAITNTQGRIKLVGMRADSDPGDDLKGPII